VARPASAFGRDISLPTFLISPSASSSGFSTASTLDPGPIIACNAAQPVSLHERRSSQAAIRPSPDRGTPPMSHEEIRFISAEEVLRDSAQAAPHQGEGLPADAVTPLKVRVKRPKQRRRDRLARRPPERVELPLAARRLPLRHMQHRARDHGPRTGRAQTKAAGTRSPSTRPRRAPTRSRRRPLRPQLQVERWPPVRHLLLDLPAQRLPVRGLQPPRSS